MSRDIDAQRYYWMLLQFSIDIECCSSTPGGALRYCTIHSRISRQVVLSRRPRYSDPATMTRWLFQDADHPSMPVPTCEFTQRLLWRFDFCGHNANQIRIIWTRAHLDVLEHPPVRFGRIWSSSFGEEGLRGLFILWLPGTMSVTMVKFQTLWLKECFDLPLSSTKKTPKTLSPAWQGGIQFPTRLSLSPMCDAASGQHAPWFHNFPGIHDKL